MEVWRELLEAFKALKNLTYNLAYETVKHYMVRQHYSPYSYHKGSKYDNVACVLGELYTMKAICYTNNGVIVQPITVVA
jgi:hypothetical protein